MENAAFWRQLTLPFMVFSALLIVVIVAGMLFYSESKGVVFRVWGHDFGTVKNAPAADAKLEKKLDSLEARLLLIEKEIQSAEQKSPASGSTKLLNKTRVLDVGQSLEDSSLPFRAYVKSAGGSEGFSNFLLELQTPESPLHTVRVTKGWNRNFDAGPRSFIFRVIDVDQKLVTITVLLKETTETR